MIVSELAGDEASHRRVSVQPKGRPAFFENQARKMGFAKGDAFSQSRHFEFPEQIVQPRPKENGLFLSNEVGLPSRILLFE